MALGHPLRQSTILLYISMCIGVIPRDLKIARITPVYRGKGSKYDESNYRPISVIVSLAMLLEREVAKEVMKYLLDKHACTQRSHVVFR